MSLSPIANRSFLHGDRKPSPNSEKIVYATLDSLALKRARLPLQLLPIDANNATEKAMKPKKKRNASGESATKRSSFKDNATNVRTKQHPKYLLVIPSATAEEKQTERSETEADEEEGTGSVIIKHDRRKVDFIQRPDTDDNDNSIKVAGFDPIYHAHSCNVSNDGNSIFSDGSCENNAYPVHRSVRRSLSDDYEKIELIPSADETLSTGQKDATKDNEIVEDEKPSPSKSVPLKSKSANDLTGKSLLDTQLDDGTYLVETLDEEKSTTESLLGVEDDTVGKKKKHFAKNVLHFVPGYLAKGPKRTKKKKSSNLSLSLSSLKPLSIDSNIGTSFDSRYRSRSLSREELKYLKISSPTNFVHVASATNPSLVWNENAIGLSLEQVVITHEEKCATLPLLVSRDKNWTIESRTEQRSIVIEKMPLLDANVTTPGRNYAANRDDLKRKLLCELQARSAKILERSQQVKTSETRDARHGEIHESLAELASTLPLPRANSSFLWSSRAKNRLNLSESTPNECTEEPDAQQYDDVGPLDFINQEDDYDDVGLPANLTNGSYTTEPTCTDLDSIYDDVMVPSDAENARTNLLPREVSAEKDSTESSNVEISEDKSSEGNWHYLSTANEYSSVDEEEMDEMQDEEQGVYDDVGLPSEERVNSLYAGSTTGSILGKESEWEDLDDPTAATATIGRESDLSAGTQMVSSKKRWGPKWSRKVRRQRSRASRKSWIPLKVPAQNCTKNTTIDADDTTSDDSIYESLHSFQLDDFSSDSETETEVEIIDEMDDRSNTVQGKIPPSETANAYLEAPTRPNPPPPREASLTETLGRRIKMLRRTWSITKGSLGRMRRRTSVDDDHSYGGEEGKDSSSNDHASLDGGRYFGFARHFKKSVTGLSTFYLNGYTTNGSNGSTSTSTSSDRLSQEPMRNNSVSNRELDHYSVLADQEPLYQFYAAAAARVAFDSNSDDYEEVEDAIPSRSTTNLAKPGHRTLWCQTPQVLSSDLIQRLSTEERKIQEAKFEILTSEASYLNSLRVIENEFLNESSINETLTPIEKDKLFGGIPSVLHASEQFLAELEVIWRHDPMLHGLPDVLLKYAGKSSDIYVAYCSNQVSIDTTLKDLRTRKGIKFLETVSQIEARPTCQSLSLHSFLMLPLQRITRLPLLADAVLSKLSVAHPDRSQWERVLASLSNVVAECNEGARSAAQQVEMESLARKLEYSVKLKPIILKGKHLVKSGAVVQLLTKSDTEYKLTFGKKFNKTPLHLLLLTDHLLVAKHKSNTHDETYTVIDTCKRSLMALEPVPEESPFAGRNGMILTLLENYSGHQVEYILTCESNTERQRWLEAVSPSKRGLADETLYEVWDCPQVVVLYSYSPSQPDELSLHPGDVINVLRKMSDGWFHGEKLLDGEQGWFPGNYTKEVASEHVRARNLKQRHRLLALNGSALQRKAKQQFAIY
ncbi:ephexin isoform X2 [Andrena cerasifolii]|uniref:ephexin isoform X2 n=1 Tax=Andrena cerasifolii TaxID=2819439 RepID=UPI00403781D6